ncbi:MAG: hypothetical protein KC535_03530 [Nanoarchaeota archaeon]|nr:hypothetical protein [Nanoarchaeota archaeon]
MNKQALATKKQLEQFIRMHINPFLSQRKVTGVLREYVRESEGLIYSFQLEKKNPGGNKFEYMVNQKSELAMLDGHFVGASFNNDKPYRTLQEENQRKIVAFINPASTLL